MYNLPYPLTFLFYPPGRGDPSEVAASLFHGIQQYLAKKQHHHLKQIIVAVYQSENLPVYQRHVGSSGSGWGILRDAYRGMKSKCFPIP